jgi:hypothetical protein
MLFSYIIINYKTDIYSNMINFIENKISLELDFILVITV